MTEAWRVILVTGESVNADVTWRDGYTVARITRRGVPNESVATKPRAAILRAADVAGILGDVASLAPVAAARENDTPR